MQTQHGVNLLSLVIRVFSLSLLFRVQVGTSSQRKMYDLLLDSSGEDRKLFLHLLILNFLQLKIILMAKRHI